jgi:hypothetical protein
MVAQIELKNYKPAPSLASQLNPIIPA